MPRKGRKRSLSLDTNKQIASRKRRQSESPQKQSQRLQEQQQRQSHVRQNETQLQKDTRTADDRQRKSQNRLQETPEKNQQRLQEQQQRQSQVRQNETQLQKDTRTADDRQRKSQNRLQETPEKNQQRLQEQQQRQSQVRQNETQLQKDTRTADDRQRKTQNRLQETPEKNQQRLQEQQQRQSHVRQNETQLQKDTRTAADRQRKSQNRLQETPENNQQRLQNQARRQADLRKRQTKKAVQEQSRLGIIGDCAYFSESDYPEPLLTHRLPSLYDANNVCLHCGALRWKQERAGFCCENGRVQLASPAIFPPTLMEIYGNKNFLKNIRAYNNALALASVGCHEQILPNWNPTFKIQGKVFHRIGALTPAAGSDPKFAQIYFTDTEHEVENRLTHNKHLDVNILRTLQTCLKDVNPYIESLKYATDFYADNPDTQIIIEAKKKPQEEHARRFNAPTGSEVAIIMPGDHIEHLDVILQSKGGDIQTINEMHRSYDPLHYVLLFPFGDDGYTDNIPQSTLTKRKDKSTLRVQFPQPSTSAAASIVPSNKRITPSQFYRYKLQVRPKEDNMLLKSRRLTQQYATDMFAKVESQRLRWVKNNQKEIRADKYRCLLDAIDADDERNAGRKVILPPTVYGSPRWYAEAFQDAMALVRKFGKPDLFITMTTNPNWPEIQHSLFPGESPVDRPDITARVFNIKHKELLDELVQKQTLGKVLAYTSMKEDQKRGLPHAHILCIMAPEDKPRTPQDIDKLVSAEIPDKNTNPKLHAIVTKHMCHGPCGNVNVNSPCMETKDSLKVCGKQFPKEFCSATTVTPNGYPKYRRRAPDDGGRTYNVQVRGNGFTVDNSWIVPYNPYISLKFNAHINVEVVTSVESVKYVGCSESFETNIISSLFLRISY